MDAALQRRLSGEGDSRGPVGILSRGANVYNGASMSAHSGGGPQFGRPRTNPQSQQQSQPSNSLGDIQFGLVNLNPKPVNLLGAIQRRLGSSNGTR